MFCAKCGNDLGDSGSKFCPDCGSAAVGEKVSPNDQAFTRKTSPTAQLSRQARNSRSSGVPSARRSRQEFILDLFGSRVAKIVFWTLGVIAAILILEAIFPQR